MLSSLKQVGEERRFVQASLAYFVIEPTPPPLATLVTSSQWLTALWQGRRLPLILRGGTGRGGEIVVGEIGLGVVVVQIVEVVVTELVILVVLAIEVVDIIIVQILEKEEEKIEINLEELPQLQLLLQPQLKDQYQQQSHQYRDQLKYLDTT